MEMSNAGSMSQRRGGQLYMQMNEIRNTIVHYRWSTSGTLTEKCLPTAGGAGSGTVKPIGGQESAPNAFEGAGSVSLTAAVIHLSAFPFCREPVL
jgi:hypothetical protein